MIANFLHDPVTHVDNLFADTWKQLRFGSLIHRAGFRKRSGTDIVDIVFSHVMALQVLTLGLATDEAFLPLDSQIYISNTKDHSLIEL